jgi:hypothetical protein
MSSDIQKEAVDVNSPFDAKLLFAMNTIETLFTTDVDQAKVACIMQRWAAELDAHYKESCGKGVAELAGMESLQDWAEANLLSNRNDNQNPNILAHEFEVALRELYETKVVPAAERDGFDPVKLFDDAVDKALVDWKSQRS